MALEISTKLLSVLIMLLLMIENTAALKALGYYFMDASYTSLVAEYSKLDEVSIDVYSMNRKGQVSGTTPTQAMNYAAKNNQTKLFLVISNYGSSGFSSSMIHSVLSNANYRNTLMTQVIAKAIADGFNGVNIDFENVPHKDRTLLTSFVSEFSSKLHNNSLLLVMSVPPIQQDSPSDSWSGAYDYAQLGLYVDILQVMTYDEHGPWSAPGAVAGLDWVKACINYTMSVVPKDKISMGVPAYGYIWNLLPHTGSTIFWKNLPALLKGKTVHWSNSTSSPYVKWTDSKGNHESWFENTESIQLKGEYARSVGIHGVSVWALGEDDPSFWDALL